MAKSTNTATQPIEINLLGGLRIRVQEEEQPAPAGKTQHLLAYLLLQPRAIHAREALAERLWPDMPPTRSRRNLSDTLYRLRRLIPGEWLDAGATTLAIKADAPLVVDVWAFQQAAQGETHEELVQAVDLYRAALLPDLYEDWIEPHRRALQEQYLAALLRLASCYEGVGELENAQQVLLRALQADPILEDAYRGLMRVLARMNRLRDALDTYEQLVDLLEREVSAPPSPETRALADALFHELELTRQAAPADAGDLWRPRFVGRRRERSEMLAAIETALQGQGCALAVDGPAGIGKTRLLEEIQVGAQWRGATIVWARATERPAASSLAPLVEAVGDALAGPRAAQIETLIDAETLVTLGALYAPWAVRGAPLELPPEQAQQRFLTAVVDLFATLAELNPLVLIADDLQWADPTLWFLLDGLVSHSRQLPLALLLSYRREAVEEGSGWDYLQKWEREGLTRIYTLAALDYQEVVDLMGAQQEDQAAAVWAGSGGNPFYVVQALAALAEGEAPHTRVTPARVAGLDATARQALEMSAVLGRTVPYRLLAAGAPAPARDLIGATDELVARHLLEPIDGGYRFVHDLVQEAVYSEIEPARRAGIHAQVAQLLAAQEPQNLRGQAYHLEQGGQLLQAGEVYAEVARQEIARFAYSEAQRALIKAREFLPPTSTPERIALLLELARISNIAGDVTRTASALDDALAAAQSLGREDLELTARIQMADLAARIGRHDEAEAEFQAARALAEARQDQAALLSVLVQSSDFLVRIGRFEDAKVNFEAAIELARALNDKDREGRALEGLGWVLAGLGASSAEVVSYMEQALAAHAIGGNRFEEARTRLNLFSALQNAGKWDRLLALEASMLEGLHRVGYRRGLASAYQALCWMHLGLGDFEAARKAGMEAQALFEEIGEQMGASLAISAQGAIVVQQGKRNEARRYLEQALGITKELGSDVFEAYAHHELGVFLFHEGDYAQAIEQFEEANAHWRRIGDPFDLIRTQTRLAQVFAAQGARAEAERLAEEAWTYFLAGMPESIQTLDWLSALYELNQALGQTDRTRSVIESAYQELLRQAGQIEDGDVRRRFVENVPTNRAITAAYDALHAIARQVSVRLAPADAPLGRALAPDEKVDVAWTVQTPADEAIADRTARRRHVLQRLHQEAAVQEALPTDDDLAQALNVSRRTILRDIQVLAEDGIRVATRARR